MSFGEVMLRQCLFSSIFNVPLSPSCKETLFRIIVQKGIKVAQVSSDFTCLSNKLQQNLLENNISAITTIRFAAMDRIKDVKESMKRTMGPTDLDIATSLRNDVMNSPTAAQLDQSTIGYRFGSAHECFIKRSSEKKHQYLRSMIGTNVAYDQKLAVLLTYVSLFSHDGNSEYLSASEKLSLIHI